MEKERQITIDENDEIVTLTYDDGSQEDLYCMAELDHKGKWYVYLQPVQPDEEFEDDEVIIYEVAENEDGEEIFLPVEDDTLIDELIEELNDAIEEEE